MLKKYPKQWKRTKKTREKKQEKRANKRREENKEDIFTKVDDAFGQYFVGPLATVLFWDVMFWDNQLSVGDGVGSVNGDEYVSSYNGVYTLQPQFSVLSSDVIVRLDSPEEYKNDYFTWTISQDGDRGFYTDIPATTVPSLEVELTPIAEWQGAALPSAPALTEGKERFATVALTEKGFPVLVDREMARKEEAETLPPYEVLAAKHMVNAERYSPSENSTVWVEKEGAWNKATFVESKDKITTSFNKKDGEGFSRSDTTSNISIVRGVDTVVHEGVLPNPDNISLPAVVIWLVFGAIFFTFRMGFISIRGFGHAIKVVRGDFDHEEDEGEVSHFQALSSALSATVGLGNIAGVAIAVAVGGPGAIFWMVMAGFLGMSSKFTECTLGQMYRTKDASGATLGGPMRYLDVGLAELKMGGLGKVLAVLFAVMCIGGSFGGGNMFQANQSFVAVSDLIPFLGESEYGALVYGIVLAILTGIVILGGIKSIGKVAEIIVPMPLWCPLLLGLSSNKRLLQNLLLVA